MKLESLVESLLFVASKPVAIADLAAALDVTAGQIQEALQTLAEACQDRGIRVQRKNDHIQLVSAPEAGPHIEKFLGLDISGKPSPAALETLSIVAYRQPVTRAQVDAIRGVNSDAVLRALVRRGLLEEVGRADTVGHPILYGTTFEFLQQFGLSHIQDLPDWETWGQRLQGQEQAALDPNEPGE